MFDDDLPNYPIGPILEVRYISCIIHFLSEEYAYCLGIFSLEYG